MTQPLTAPFIYFGGKRSVTGFVWSRLGRPKMYVEPFLGSAAMLLAAPRPASLEVAGDLNLYVANFWRAVKYQPDEAWLACDYPVSHIDQIARHRWLTEPERVADLRSALMDPAWPGDARIAGWWVWGQNSWIGSGWCSASNGLSARSEKKPHLSNAGQAWFRRLSARLERVRLVHGSWDQCLNHHYGGKHTAFFFDPPYAAFEKVYTGRADSRPVAYDVADWCRAHGHLKIALCGHAGDYELPGWDVVGWSRPGNTYGSNKTKDTEAIWFSPACGSGQRSLFAPPLANPAPGA